jgi:hypothetical protein
MEIWRDLLDVLTNEVLHRIARHICQALIQMSNDSLIVKYGDSVGQHFQDVAREGRMIFEVPHAVLTFIDVTTNESIVS